MPDTVTIGRWRRQGDAFHPTILDQKRAAATAEALAAIEDCRVNLDGQPCGYCHNCGAKLPWLTATWCRNCGSTDEDE